MGERRTWACCLILSTLGVSLVHNARAQEMSSLERHGVQEMLQTVSKEVTKHYYDPKLHGLDWKATVEKARERIDRENDVTLALGDVAAALESLNDSHTFFVPPRHAYHIDYGWQYQIIGSHCFVTRVRPGSDAEAKGVRPGDEVLAINGFQPLRDNLAEMHYILQVLRPQPDLNVRLRDPAGRERQLKLVTKIEQAPNLPDSVLHHQSIIAAQDVRHALRPHSVEVAGDLLIARIPDFLFTEFEINQLMGEARKHQYLIIDLRDNPGGSAQPATHLVGDIFDHDLTIANRVRRDETKPVVAKSMGGHAFTGKLVVLVDSESASAAEVFARTVQIEKRGTVLGDRTSGRVMEAQYYTYPLGASFYALSLTVANLVMADGKSLEHTGVTPDEVVLPSGADLAVGRDPVLARAAEMLGAKLSAEDAGKLFPYEWPPETP